MAEIISGSRVPASANASSMATSAAFALSVSICVSTSSRWHPPSINPRAWSLNACFIASNVIARKAGLFTSGEIDRVLVVGPIEPATKRGRSGVLRVHSSATRRASRAASRFNSYATASSP